MAEETEPFDETPGAVRFSSIGVYVPPGRESVNSSFCGKGHDNWSSWTSSDGTVHKYCKTCRQARAKTYLSRKKGSAGRHTKAEWIAKLERFDRCPGCTRKWKDIPSSRGSAKYKITKDHIIPLLSGGTDDIENIRPLCYQCNFEKGHSVTGRRW